MSFGFECKARYSNAQTVLGASLSVGRCIKVNIKIQVPRCSMMPVIAKTAQRFARRLCADRQNYCLCTGYSFSDEKEGES